MHGWDDVFFLYNQTIPFGVFVWLLPNMICISALLILFFNGRSENAFRLEKFKINNEQSRGFFEVKYDVVDVFWKIEGILAKFLFLTFEEKSHFWLLFQIRHHVNETDSEI